jgi:hypothetical protein
VWGCGFKPQNHQKKNLHSYMTSCNNIYLYLFFIKIHLFLIFKKNKLTAIIKLNYISKNSRRNNNVFLLFSRITWDNSNKVSILTFVCLNSNIYNIYYCTVKKFNAISSISQAKSKDQWHTERKYLQNISKKITISLKHFINKRPILIYKLDRENHS